MFRVLIVIPVSIEQVRMLNIERYFVITELTINLSNDLIDGRSMIQEVDDSSNALRCTNPLPVIVCG